MVVKGWYEARARLVEKRPDVELGIVTGLWESRGSFAFAVKTDAFVEVVWVGPRGGVATSLRYPVASWAWLVQTFGIAV